MFASISSIYMSNISTEVIKAQEKCVLRVLPEGWEFKQILTTDSHPVALEKAIASSKYDINILLDCDCIPLTQLGLELLAKQVIQDEERGLNQGLAGCIQRANHISNNRHLYVGPFCMAFSRNYYADLGSPSFVETNRGDVGEELTYRWTEKSGFLSPAGMNPHKYSSNVHFLWPTHVRQPLWDLDFTWKFGIGTTYGAAGVGPSLFYHTFNARDPRTAEMFIFECNRMLTQQGREA